MQSLTKKGILEIKRRRLDRCCQGCALEFHEVTGLGNVRRRTGFHPLGHSETAAFGSTGTLLGPRERRPNCPTATVVSAVTVIRKLHKQTARFMRKRPI